jgi:hypothetical protein
MADPLDRLFEEWHQLGGAVLLAGHAEPARPRLPEEILAESTAHCRESGRLTWVALDWLMRHVEHLDAQRLIDETREVGDLSVLGVLADAARLRRPHPTFERIVAACHRHDRLEPFFYRVARSPLALRLTRENALVLFRNWNFLCSELRYLDARSQVKP